MKTQVFSPYRITWVQVKSTNGIITLDDARKISYTMRVRKIDLRRHQKTHIYLHFPNKEQALMFIIDNAGKTKKRYECRLFSDKQLEKAEIIGDTLQVPFTTKQQNEIYYI